MALIPAKFKSATAVKLATTLGHARKHFRQFTLYADPANTGSIYLGLANVTGVPANELLKIAAGVSVNLGPQNNERPFVVDTDRHYLVGSDANQICWVVVNTDDGHRSP